ncbi:MCP four helix bundle domain-containing protein, partial [uncultured Acetobacterium sp.]|uniref:MCP four helix bundle domain-containing protein n=1 Tax=uncultured Acetobacterium sp. TaxID=217139 RepID=UPI0025F588EA
MKTFANMKVKAKLLVGFIIMAIIVGIVGVVGITNIKALDESDTELYENITVPIGQAGQISTAFQRMRVNIRDMIIANDPEVIKENADKIAERQAEIDTLTAEFESRIVSDQMRTAFDEFVEARQNYKGSITELMALANQNQDAQAFALMAETGSSGIAARAEQDAIAKLVELKLADGSAKATANTVQANSVVTTMIIVILVGVLMSIMLGLFLGSTISKPLKKAAAMLKEMSMGHLGMRLKMDSKDEIGQMAISMDSFADDLQNVVIGTMKQISNGDVSANIEIRDELDEIAPALKETIESIRALIVEANMLSQAAVEGRLDTRGNADAFNGGYKEIVEGVNNTLDSVVGPLNVAAEYVERISKGDIPPKITDSYNGDFNEIKNNLNTCIDAITALVDDAAMLAEAGIAGQLDTRADASKHGGDFAKIVDGVNSTLDAVIGPLNVAAEYVD